MVLGRFSRDTIIIILLLKDIYYTVPFIVLFKLYIAYIPFPLIPLSPFSLYILLCVFVAWTPWTVSRTLWFCACNLDPDVLESARE